MKYALVGFVGALLGGAVVWAARPEPAAPGPEHAPTRAERRGEPESRRAPTAFADSDDQATLAECRQALVQQRTELRLVREAAARAVEQADVEDEDVAPPRSTSGSGAGGSDDEGSGAADAAGERQRNQKNTERVREAVLSHLNVNDEERQLVKDLVCTQRDNVRGLYDDLGAGAIDDATFLQSLAQERKLTSEALGRALGRRRYREFRELGVIGLLVPTLCKKR